MQWWISPIIIGNCVVSVFIFTVLVCATSNAVQVQQSHCILHTASVCSVIVVGQCWLTYTAFCETASSFFWLDSAVKQCNDPWPVVLFFRCIGYINPLFIKPRTPWSIISQVESYNTKYLHSEHAVVIKTRSGSVLTGLIPQAATNSSFFKSMSKSRSMPLGQKYWYQQKGLVIRNRWV